MCYYIPNHPPCTCTFLQLFQPCERARLYPAPDPATNPNPVVHVCETKIIVQGATQRYCYDCNWRYAATAGLNGIHDPVARFGAVDPAASIAPADIHPASQPLPQPFTPALMSDSHAVSYLKQQQQFQEYQQQQLPLSGQLSGLAQNVDIPKDAPVSVSTQVARSSPGKKKKKQDRSKAQSQQSKRRSPQAKPASSSLPDLIPRSVPTPTIAPATTVVPTAPLAPVPLASLEGRSVVNRLETLGVAPTAGSGSGSSGGLASLDPFGRVSGAGNETSYAHLATDPTMFQEIGPQSIESQSSGIGTLMSYGDVRFLVELDSEGSKPNGESERGAGGSRLVALPGESH